MKQIVLILLLAMLVFTACDGYYLTDDYDPNVHMDDELNDAIDRFDDDVDDVVDTVDEFAEDFYDFTDDFGDELEDAINSGSDLIELYLERLMGEGPYIEDSEFEFVDGFYVGEEYNCVSNRYEALDSEFVLNGIEYPVTLMDYSCSPDEYSSEYGNIEFRVFPVGVTSYNSGEELLRGMFLDSTNFHSFYDYFQCVHLDSDSNFNCIWADQDFVYMIEMYGDSTYNIGFDLFYRYNREYRSTLGEDFSVFNGYVIEDGFYQGAGDGCNSDGGYANNYFLDSSLVFESSVDYECDYEGFDTTFKIYSSDDLIGEALINKIYFQSSVSFGYNYYYSCLEMVNDNGENICVWTDGYSVYEFNLGNDYLYPEKFYSNLMDAYNYLYYSVLNDDFTTTQGFKFENGLYVGYEDFCRTGWYDTSVYEYEGNLREDGFADYMCADKSSMFFNFVTPKDEDPMYLFGKWLQYDIVSGFQPDYGCFIVEDDYSTSCVWTDGYSVFRIESDYANDRSNRFLDFEEEVYDAYMSMNPSTLTLEDYEAYVSTGDVLSIGTSGVGGGSIGSTSS